MADLAANVAQVRARIAAAAGRSGRRAEDVLLVAVSKTVDAARVREAAALGLPAFGENRVQEAREKAAAVPDVSWHLIGSLQRNKAKEAARLFTVIESVDSEALAEELSRRAEQQKRAVDVLVQVNVAREPQKHGASPEEAAAVVRRTAALPGLRLRGLMTIAPAFGDPDQARPVFRMLRELRESIRRSAGVALPELSMGMTDDFEVAIEEGATMVRIGRAIFADRGRT
ncbi:MAG TPA: YggS family pyridoxal phosphate-dependent enzyme [bacterium]|nr:YggS family pyridoxal phosphate-dependent enzyme [bacterium]